MGNFIPYGRQSIDDNDIDAVVEVLKSDFLTQGPKVGQFEEALAEYCGTRHAVVFSSGTAALHAAYFAAGIGDGDEIVTSPITFAATANAALYLGAKPVFVDVEPDTGNIDASLIEKAITEKTKAIVPVHYAGHPVDLDPIHALAKQHGLVVIEDACHALGATYKGKSVGSISGLTVFSFHPLKHITTGEGGAVLTDDPELYEKLRSFRTHGITKEAGNFKNTSPGKWYHEMHVLGYNYRMNDIQAALGLSQLKKLEGFLARRKELAEAYDSAFKGEELISTPLVRDYAGHAWHLYPIRLQGEAVERKSAIFDAMLIAGIGVQVHYIPVYTQPFYHEAGYSGTSCPNAEDFYLKELSIPIHPCMSRDDEAHVIKTLVNAVRGDDR